MTAIKFSCYDQIKQVMMPQGEKAYGWGEGFARKAPKTCLPPAAPVIYE